jgi:hypothetical protein
MRLSERLEAARRFTWKNLDALLVIVVAFGVAILQVVESPKPELVNAAILGVLGVTAIVLLRDRVGRDNLAKLEQLAGDAISDRPYEVVWQNNHWDLRDRHHTTVKVTEQVRFTRNDVSTLADWSQGPGEVTRYDAKWRRSRREKWIDATKIHTFPIRNGEKVIFSLEEEHCRGDMLDWTVERDAVGRFPTAHESVSLEARTSSDHPRVMQITWPQDAVPTHVEIRFKGQPARTIATKRKRGRPFVEEKIAGLAIGESVEIAWTW